MKDTQRTSVPGTATEEFQQTEDLLAALTPPPDAKLYRYIDLTKYISFLETSALYFARVDLLGDPLEGSYPRINVAVHAATAAHLGARPQTEEFWKKGRKDERRWVYANCWYEGEYESVAMWSTFGKIHGAISVVTTCARLRSQLPDTVGLYRVRYIDYDNDWFPEGRAYVPFLHKDRSLNHEHEVRAIFFEIPATPGAPVGEGENWSIYDQQNPNNGVSMKVSIPDLIIGAHVAPGTPTWVLDVVKSVTERYGYTFPVSQSALDREPLF